MLENGRDTFPKLFLHHFQKRPDGVAMRKKNFGIWKEYTWKECFQRVKYFSLGLIHLGLQPGDRVAIIGEKEPEWFWAEFSAQAAGAMIVGIYTDMVPSEIKYIAEQCAFKFALANDQEQVDKFLEMKKELPALQQVIYQDPRGLKNYDDPLLKSFEEVLELGRKVESAHPGVFEENVAKGRGEDCAAIYYTSGTAGLPKAAMVSHQALINSGKAFLEFNPTSHNENSFSHMPTAWVGEGMLATAGHLLSGVILNFAEEPETVQEDLREIAPEVVFYGPRQWEDLARMIQLKMRGAGPLNRLLYRIFVKVGYERVEWIEQKKGRGLFLGLLLALGDLLVFHPLRENLGLKKCKIAITAGSPISIDTFRFWTALGVGLKQVYGSTEAGFIAGHRSGQIRSGTVGNISPLATVKISEAGEIWVKGPAIFTGYYQSPEKTQETLVDGWVHTGDAGFIDSQGQLVLLDRLSDVGHLSNGAQFIPQYIEGRLRFSPYIKDAMVLGGDEKDFLAVIITVDFENLGKWAEEHRIKYMTFAELSQQEEVARLIRADIQRLNQETPAGTRIKKFAVLHKEFHPNEGELTRTRKLKRRFVEALYAPLVNALYSETRGVEVEALVKYRDGRDEVMKTDIKIWPVDEEAR